MKRASSHYYENVRCQDERRTENHWHSRCKTHLLSYWENTAWVTDCFIQTVSCKEVQWNKYLNKKIHGFFLSHFLFVMVVWTFLVMYSCVDNITINDILTKSNVKAQVMLCIWAYPLSNGLPTIICVMLMMLTYDLTIVYPLIAFCFCFFVMFFRFSLWFDCTLKLINMIMLCCAISIDHPQRKLCEIDFLWCLF